MQVVTKVESALAYLLEVSLRVPDLAVPPGGMEVLASGQRRLRALLRGSGVAGQRSVIGMLKTWLAENMPKIVERALRREMSERLLPDNKNTRD